MATSKSTTAKKTTTIKPVTKPVTRKSTAATTKVASAKVTAKTSGVAVNKAPVTKKASIPKPIAPVTKKRTTTPTKSSLGKIPVIPTPEQRYRMVQDAAYFIAEKNGFESGSMDYWIAAEAEIAVLLSGQGKK